MTVRMIRVPDGLQVDPRDSQAFARYKAKLPEGEVVTAEFRKTVPDASERARNYFHALRDKYAAALGYDREHAKNELCVRFGVALEEEAAHTADWEGRFVEIWGARFFRKSLNYYNKKELSNLVECTIAACIENDIDVAEVVSDYRRGV